MTGSAEQSEQLIGKKLMKSTDPKEEVELETDEKIHFLDILYCRELFVTLDKDTPTFDFNNLHSFC